MRAWRAGMITMLVAGFILALSLPPSVRAQARADIWLEAPVVASTGVLRIGGESVVGSYTFGVDDPADENDDRVPVALATFGAAVGLMLVGSAGYLLRRRLGLIKPPPTQDREH